MTTPAPPQPTPAMLRLTLPQGATAAETEAELERYARLQNLGVGLRRARALDNVAEPPQAGPRDLAGLATAMAGAHAAQAFYFHQPGWSTLNQIHQRASEILRELNEQAERTPQAAIQAARITSLAASLIARHAAQIQTYLNTWNQSNTPGAEAMRYLTRAAEDHAARASGVDDGQTLDTPRLLMAHAYQLNRELQRAEAARPGPPTDPKLDDPDDPALESALSLGALYDRGLAEAARLGDSLSELSGRARRIGHRAVLDVRLHGMIEALQIRTYEMVSGIARRLMNRYDELGWQNDGRRTIAATIFHYAEQRLERIRGVIGPDEQREVGYYEVDAPDRYLDALWDENRTVINELKSLYLRPEDRSELQIRYLLVQRELAADAGDVEWGTQPFFPPKEYVAGVRADNPVAARLELIDALRRRVERNPYDHDASFLNQVADRLAKEIAGPDELTPEAAQTLITPAQLRTAALHLVEKGTAASPLALASTAELNLTHAQAERILHELQTLNVVGPPNGLEPRQLIATTPAQLPAALTATRPTTAATPLQAPAPGTETEQAPASAPPPAQASTPTPAPAQVTDDQLRRAALAAAANRIASPELFVKTLSVSPAEGQALMEALQERQLVVQVGDGAWEPTFDQEGVDAALKKPTLPPEAQPAEGGQQAASLPRRDRTVERPHPGNLTNGPKPDPRTLSDEEVARLLQGSQDKILRASQALKDGVQNRAAAQNPQAAGNPRKTDEAQQNSQQARQTISAGVR
ncbi:hypothetical protein ACFRR6_01560 [Streptomyces sp. NPDC056891]|uniref:hypothetical protein n=1 Tax=Streptomyces sp. NPDC056891 TaxID=3345961 RepID=UPI00368A2A65